MIINIFNSDPSNIIYIKTKNCKNMTTIAYRISKFDSMIKNPIVTNYGFLTSITFSRISFLYQFCRNTSFTRSNLQKDCYQDNLPFVFSQFYRDNCKNILAGNIGSMQVKNQ